MMDIVERLRERWCGKYNTYGQISRDMELAADEIERLRETCNQSEAMAQGEAAEVARLTADNARLIGEVAALKQLLNRVMSLGEIAVVSTANPFTNYGGKKPPNKEVWQIPRYLCADIDDALKEQKP